MFSEAEIRAALKGHGPANGDVCMCAWAIPSANTEQEFTADHFIDVLKAAKPPQVPEYPVDDNGHRCPMELRRPW